MIIADYSTFRSIANPGGSLAPDGLTEFDPSMMRANGFDGGIERISSISFPLKLTCNGGDFDASPGVDEYDWYVSQGTSIAANKPLNVSRFDSLPSTSYSGTILLQLESWAIPEYPDPFDLSTVRVLFFGIDIYAIRRSDASIQRFDLMGHLVDALSPKTNIQ